MRATIIFPVLVGVALAGPPARAQDNGSAGAAENTSVDTGETADLLSQDELETLVGPVALYPDTLLMQILVASTEPLEVVKAQQYLVDNVGRDPAELKPEIEATDWDPSVQVLATAFPEVVSDMATHVEWTETMGDAMLAQSDDVLAEIQDLRQEAADSGALTSGEQQTVEVQDNDTVVITPTDPQVVYVPQYQPVDVWGGVGDAVAIGAVAFGTAAVIDAIFDDDDDWDDYWGCHNCGGWNGRPIIRDPDVDIDVDGNVNIGNRVDLGDRDIDLGDRSDLNFGDRGDLNLGDRGDLNLGDRGDLNLGDRGDGDGLNFGNRGDGDGWRPPPDKAQAARDKIAAKKGNGGATTLQIKKPEGRTDALREKLSERSGTPDISRDRVSRGDVSLPNVDRPTSRPAAGKAAALSKTKAAGSLKKPNVSKKAVTKKAPQIKKAAGPRKGKALAKKAPAGKVKAGSRRGKAGHAKRRGR